MQTGVSNGEVISLSFANLKVGHRLWKEWPNKGSFHVLIWDPAGIQDRGELLAEGRASQHTPWKINGWNQQIEV